MMDKYVDLVKKCNDYLDKIHDMRLQYVKRKLDSISLLVSDFIGLMEATNGDCEKYGLPAMDKDASFKYICLSSDDEDDMGTHSMIRFANRIGLLSDGNIVVISENGVMFNVAGRERLNNLTDTQLFDLAKSIDDFVKYTTPIKDVLTNELVRLEGLYSQMLHSDNPFVNAKLDEADIINVQEVHLEDDVVDDEVNQVAATNDIIIEEESVEAVDEVDENPAEIEEDTSVLDVSEFPGEEEVSEFEESDEYETQEDTEGESEWVDDTNMPDLDDSVEVYETELEDETDFESESEEYNDEESNEDEYDEDLPDKLNINVSASCIPNFKRDKFREYQEVNFNIREDGEESSALFMINSRACKMINNNEITITVETKNHYKVYKSSGATLNLSGVELKRYYNRFADIN